MNKFQKTSNKIIRQIFDHIMSNGLMQEENTASGERYVTPGMPEYIRACAEEGIVLLQNDGTLPLKKEDVVSVFGRCQLDWFYVGYGSGGDVHPPYFCSMSEGLTTYQIQTNTELAEIYRKWCEDPEHEADHGWWGHWPYYYPEMPLSDEVVEKASKKSSVALVVIGRAAGEDRENRLQPGSYYLTELEHAMLKSVCNNFEKVVLIMNCGSIIDLSFLSQYRLSAVLYAWQLGQESGNALASVLSGVTNPSGKLTDTVAKSYEDYPSTPNFGLREFNNYVEDIYIGYRYFDTFHPEKVLFPFGFGLSYTTFIIEAMGLSHDNGITKVNIQVTNTGDVAGKEVIQLYCVQARGKLGKANKVLAAFTKTELLQPGQKQEVRLEVSDYELASFDDSGITGFASSFVLEAGTYLFLVGNDSNANNKAGSFHEDKTRCLKQCEPICGVQKENAFKVITTSTSATSDSTTDSVGSNIVSEMRNVNVVDYNLRDRILVRLPKEIPVTGDRGIQLADVKTGKNTLDEFIAQLTDKELADLSRGEGGMGSTLGITGNAGAFGGITEELRAKGVPALITADGPAGLRIKRYTSLLPCGTAIACTWNTRLVEQLFEREGEEETHYGVDVILSPGMNLHRNPLCGRNFEYYSEDPVLSGKIAAAAVRGIQKGGASACPKHFACNHQEVNRNHNDSRVSERALREIYLKNFEICVTEGRPQNLMTSYNKINGVWSHYNYDLVTTVLRGEWKYDGNVITDWWMRKSKSPEFPKIKDNAYRVRAQVDVLMPGSVSPMNRKYVFDKEQLRTLGQKDGITRGELQRTAKNVLKFALTRM